jgi:hypothetical protein
MLGKRSGGALAEAIIGSTLHSWTFPDPLPIFFAD